MDNFATTAIRSVITYRIVQTRYLKELFHRDYFIANEVLSTAGKSEKMDRLFRASLRSRLERTPSSEPGGYRAAGSLTMSHVRELVSYAPVEGHRFSRYNEEAWYCALRPQTSIDEVAFHKRETLRKSGQFGEVLEYQELIASVSGRFCDLRLLPEGEVPPELHEDTGLAYPYGQAFADRVREHGLDGIIHQSVRDRDGFCIVVFNLDSLGEVNLGTKWQIRWNRQLQHSAQRVGETDS